MLPLLRHLLPDVLRHPHSHGFNVRQGELRDDSLWWSFWNIRHDLCYVQQVRLDLLRVSSIDCPTLSLACHGLRCWRRSFLIPWLSFYLMVLGIVTTCSLQALYSQNFLLEWRHIFLFFAIFTIFYCWSHIKKQFLVMAFPRPDQVLLSWISVEK